MDNIKIEFPEVETYYIGCLLLNQTTPTSYGSVKPNQCLEAIPTAEYVESFIDFSLWRDKLLTLGVTVFLDADGNWNE